MPRALLLLLCGLCLGPGVSAGEIRIAVASNFAPTLQRLAELFQSASGHRVLFAAASTGKHYAQIRQGAAFDLFLAADSERPERLEREGVGVPGSRFVYAEGRLALWAPGQDLAGGLAPLLQSAQVRRLAIANPRLAPYGRAAQQVLTGWGLWDQVQDRLVRGENVAQAYQFVATGNAQAGLVALAQLRQAADGAPGSYREIAAAAHAPIRQQALLLRQGAAAEAFLRYLRSASAARLIRAAGYALPGGE